MTGPIGVFDSGVGGLTVVKSLRKELPGCHIHYVADQAHVPYGGRSLEEVAGFARSISIYLADNGCQTIVMACNISSATALTTVQRELPGIRVFGMIGPAAKEAVRYSSDIAILATEGTVASYAYPKAIRQIDPHARVTQQACPKFVPLLENGESDTPGAYDAAASALRSSVAADAKVIILGCTHYPFMLDTLVRASSDLFAEVPRFLDPAEYVAKEVAGSSAAQSNLTEQVDGSGNPGDVFLTTGDPHQFTYQVRAMLSQDNALVGRLEWANGRLTAAHRSLQAVS